VKNVRHPELWYVLTTAIYIYIYTSQGYKRSQKISLCSFPRPFFLNLIILHARFYTGSSLCAPPSITCSLDLRCQTSTTTSSTRSLSLSSSPSCRCSSSACSTCSSSNPVSREACRASAAASRRPLNSCCALARGRSLGSYDCRVQKIERI
jgi:hypothetical protein